MAPVPDFCISRLRNCSRTFSAALARRARCVADMVTGTTLGRGVSRTVPSGASGVSDGNAKEPWLRVREAPCALFLSGCDPKRMGGRLTPDRLLPRRRASAELDTGSITPSEE